MSKGTLFDSGTPTLEHGPDDILTPEEPLTEDDGDHPIADTPLPGYGTE